MVQVVVPIPVVATEPGAVVRAVDRVEIHRAPCPGSRASSGWSSAYSPASRTCPSPGNYGSILVRFSRDQGDIARPHRVWNVDFNLGGVRKI